jgi:hypothetical protein
MRARQACGRSLTRFAHDGQTTPQEPINTYENQDLGQFGPDPGERKSAEHNAKASAKYVDIRAKQVQSRLDHTSGQFQKTMETLAADVFSMATGEGGAAAHFFLDEVCACWEAAENYRIAHGAYPDFFEINGLLHNRLRTAFGKFREDDRRATQKEHNSIIREARAKAAKIKQEKQKESRAQLAAELRSGRVKLRDLKSKISEAEKSLDLIEGCLPPSLAAYPDIPIAPRFRPNWEGDGLPETSGVYFLWSKEDTIDYVGKSVRLNQRLRIGGHHILQDDHRISFLLFDKQILTWAECYYIGIAKPPLNFGGAP